MGDLTRTEEALVKAWDENASLRAKLAEAEESLEDAKSHARDMDSLHDAANARVTALEGALEQIKRQAESGGFCEGIRAAFEGIVAKARAALAANAKEDGDA